MGLNIVALILAAGFSSRMGQFKLLLPFGEQPVIASAITSLRRAGVADIRVVIGHRAGELLPLLATLEVQPIRNECYTIGMFSSVQAGVATLDLSVDGFLLLPGDMPLVKVETVRKLICDYQLQERAVLYPVFQGRRGHPTLIARRCFPRILASSSEGNLREVLQYFASDAADVAVVDQSIQMDLDTPADYAQALVYLAQSYLPTPEECAAIFNLSQTPEPVIRHGKTVSRVARRLAKALNLTGRCELDLELVRVGGLLHDCARTAPEHAEAGARRLVEWGYPALYPAVAQHMDYQLTNPEAPVDEAMVIFIADKLVAGERIISLQQRYQDAARLHQEEPGVLQRIASRCKRAEDVQKKLESCLEGKTLDAIVGSEEG